MLVGYETLLTYLIIKGISKRSYILFEGRAHSFKCGLGDRGSCDGQGVDGPITYPDFYVLFVE